MTAYLQPYRAPMMECPECDGQGEALYEVMIYGGPPGAYSPYDEKLLQCQRCDGYGEIEIEEEEEFDDEDV